MPRKEGQKLKLLTLLEIFVRETDEKHPISVPRMVELLKERGIVAYSFDSSDCYIVFQKFPHYYFPDNNSKIHYQSVLHVRN